MLEAMIGLAVGGTVTVICCLIVHKISEYGKREGVVQGGQSRTPVPTEETTVEAVYEKNETE